MAWQNPHGNLTDDERRRLEREAQIYAEAQRKMLREEAKREEKQREREERRRAEERSRTESRRRLEETQRGTQVSLQGNSHKAIIAAKEEKLRALESSPAVIAHRVKTVKSSHVGSRKYLEARYGYDAYKSEYEDAYKSKHGRFLTYVPIGDKTAEEIVAENYSQTDRFWKNHECEQIEQLLGSEEHERAEYEPKCKALIEFIEKLKEEQRASSILESRISTIGSSEAGSTEYLKARYGERAYRAMLDTIVKELNINEENAAAYLTDNYSEALWKLWEDETIEQLLGNR